MKPHPAYVKAGLVEQYSKLPFHKLSPDTQKWVRSRYKKICPACAKRYFTSPCTLPVCPECWLKIPGEWRVWFWKSKRTYRSLEKLLDECFDGGYDVPPDMNQLKVSK